MILFLLVACSPTYSTSNQIRTEGEGFFDRPWPSDLRRSANGNLDMSGWPFQGQYPLLDSFLDLAEDLNGFGNNAPMYHQFTEAIDPDLLPSPLESIEADSSIFLINITEGSPNRGARVPIDMEWTTEEGQWLPDKTLITAPSWGNPLDPDADYALVFTQDIAQRSDDFVQAFDEESPLFSYYKPVIETIEYLGMDSEHISHATRFHTQNPIQEMVQIATAIRDRVSKPKLDQKLAFVHDLFSGKAYEGKLLVPLWQHGEKPYATLGGGFRFDTEGAPILFDWEYTRFTMSVPPGEMPAEGWPIAIYSHGTGGNDRGFASSDREKSPGALFSQAGYVGIGISQPLHGDRNTGGSPELYSFNYLNPESGKSTFRQGAADQIYLAHLLAAHSHQFTTDDNVEIRLNPEQIVYVGHSHGGEVGAMAIPFFPPQLETAVISGTGGGLSLALLYRKEGNFDMEEIIRNTLDISSSENLTTFHPVVALVQLNAEVTDPLNFAPYWFHKKPWWDSHPLSIYQTEGLHDEHTPPISTEALSAAAHTPIIDTPIQWTPSHEVYNLFQEGLPLQGNVTAYDGSKRTAGLRQYADEDHFVIFNTMGAAQKYKSFIETAQDGLPILD